MNLTTKLTILSNSSKFQITSLHTSIFIEKEFKNFDEIILNLIRRHSLIYIEVW